jgi:hypothetical protein
VRIRSRDEREGGIKGMKTEMGFGERNIGVDSYRNTERTRLGDIGVQTCEISDSNPDKYAFSASEVSPAMREVGTKALHTRFISQ